MDHFYQNIGENWFSYSYLYKSMVRIVPEKGHVVEVGSWKGRSSVFMAVEIINSNKKIRFDCVDTWLGSEEHKNETNDMYVPLLKDKDALYKLFLKNVEPVKEIINPIRLTSVEASKMYSDESLDFVFIDAAHDFENVKKDITHWLPKVKKGGILAGHDYSFNSVKHAVHTKFKINEIIVFEDCWIHYKI